MKKKYLKPLIRKKLIKVNTFYSNSRYSDSSNMLESGTRLLAQSSCSGCGPGCEGSGCEGCQSCGSMPACAGC